MDISTIIPLYNSETKVSHLHRALTNILSFYNNYEIIFVDDGSKDNTGEIIKKVRERDPHVRIVQFKKNTGQYEALFIGYKCSRGKIVISLDDDAFEEVNYIPEFIRKIEEGYGMVLGWRNKKGYPFLRKVVSFLFNVIISLMIGKRLHDIGSSLKAKNREVVDKLISLGGLLYFLKYYRYYKIAEIRIPSSYSKNVSTRYDIIKLAKAATLILKTIFLSTKVQLGPCREL